MLSGMLPPTSGDAMIYGKVPLITQSELCLNMNVFIWTFRARLFSSQSVVGQLAAVQAQLGVCPQQNVMYPVLVCGLIRQTWFNWTGVPGSCIYIHHHLSLARTPPALVHIYIIIFLSHARPWLLYIYTSSSFSRTHAHAAHTNTHTHTPTHCSRYGSMLCYSR